MEDRVAEILAERGGIERGAAAAVVASLFAHAALSGLAMWAAWHHSAPQAPMMMNIRFAQAKPAVSTAPPAVVAAPKQSPVAPKAPPPKAEVVKPAPKPVEASNFGKSPKKETPPAPVAAAPPAPAVTTTQPEVAIEGGDFPYTVYIDRMKALIGSRWFRPQTGTTVSTTVAFTIDRDGAIRDARVETSSGNSTFDRGALRAVLESSPLPPLPFGYSGTTLGVHLTFR